MAASGARARRGLPAVRLRARRVARLEPRAWFWLLSLPSLLALASLLRARATSLLLALPPAARPSSSPLPLPSWSSRTAPLPPRRRGRHRPLSGRRAQAEEKRIADDGAPYTKQEFLEWYAGSTAEWDRAKPFVPEPPPVPKTTKEEFAASSDFGTMRFSVNASVGHFVRPVYVRELGLLLCIGDWTGDITGLDPATGEARFTAVSSGLASIHSLAHVPEAGLMVCGSAWTGNVSAFDTATGESRWSLDGGVGEYARSVHAESAGLVVFAGGGTKPMVSGVDPRTGDVRYNIDPGIGATWTLTYVPSTGKVLCGASWTRPKKTGRVACLEPATGEVLYDIDPEVGRYVCATCPDGSDLALCAGDLGMVAGLEPATGAVRYTVNASVDEVWSLESTPSGVLCVGGWSGMVSSLDPATGDVRFVVNATIGKIFSSKYVPELGLALLANDNGTIAGLDPGSGDMKFKMDAGIHDPGPWDPIKSNPWKNELWHVDYIPEAKLVYCGGDTNFSVRALAA
mmetsp:Transcript_109739/g.350075  ORF Transcript_109739/g.350075 Transcript_109739/m.350075 type:complete len:514 (+) Transcript_109739:74-1615(+)